MTRATAAVRAIVVLVGAAAILGAAVSGATAATKPDPALLDRVPPSFAKTCTATRSVKGASAAIACTPPAASKVSNVTYARYADATTARDQYDRAAREVGQDTETDCADLGNSESPFHTSSGASGRVVCTSGRHRHTLTWLDGDVVATATGNDDARLYSWWEKLVGRSLTATQQTLLTQLPGGVRRATCRDNGDASLKCLPPDSVQDVYALYFTKYPDASSMNAAYDAMLHDAGLQRNVLPPTLDGSQCS